MQNETTANYRHTESLTLFLLNKTRPHTLRLAQIKNPERNKRKKLPLCWSRQGRWLGPSRGKKNGARCVSFDQLRCGTSSSARCPTQTLVARTVPSRSFVSHKQKTPKEKKKENLPLC